MLTNILANDKCIDFREHLKLRQGSGNPQVKSANMYTYIL